MPVPTFTPDQRAPADAPPSDSYLRGARVWLYRHDAWHPARVISTGTTGVMLRYRLAGQRGTRVDTVTADRLALRAETDVVDDGYFLAPWLLPRRGHDPATTSADATAATAGTPATTTIGEPTR